VHFSGSIIVKNDSRQFDGGFDLDNCEVLDALIRMNPSVAREESVLDPLEHVKWIGYSQR
jgi:hypothetical protein